MKRTLQFGLIVAALLAFAFYLLTIPRAISPDQLPVHDADLANGESMFWAGGCASCHAAPGAGGDALLTLSGGQEFKTPFGAFVVPNISPDPVHGIGDWSDAEFVSAMINGVSPDGAHYYPAFPYPYYQNMTVPDTIDLFRYLQSLPASDNRAAPHKLEFPYSLRRGIGLWKRRYLERTRADFSAADDAILARGAYLVHGPAHCGACHTPRDRFGGEMARRFLAGAASLEIAADSGGAGTGRVPNITPHDDGIGSWSEADISYSLETGFDPEFDTFGGPMVQVQENLARLPASDREAIARYLKSIPAVATVASQTEQTGTEK